MALTTFVMETPQAGRIFLAGDFNGWDTCSTCMTRDDACGAFVSEIDLEPGRYEYKFLVDDEWTCCETAPRVVNCYGSENNVVEVPECCDSCSV